MVNGLERWDSSDHKLIVSGAISYFGAAGFWDAPDIQEEAYDLTDIASFKSPVLLSRLTPI